MFGITIGDILNSFKWYVCCVSYRDVRDCYLKPLHSIWGPSLPSHATPVSPRRTN